jgi:hypothetical protein
MYHKKTKTATSIPRIADIEKSDGLETAFGICRGNRCWHHNNGLFLQSG